MAQHSGQTTMLAPSGSELRLPRKFLSPDWPGRLARQSDRRDPGKSFLEWWVEKKALSVELDAVDLRILDLLQRDASLSIAEVAEKVGLSSSPAWRRIERLKRIGVITKQVTLLDYEKLGFGFEVFASVKLQLPTRENLEKFEIAVADWPEVVECATVTGAVDYMNRAS
jgi:DNA-binding Lrp family transcriptional regulator